MSLNAYDLSAGLFVRGLTNLKAQLTKAEARRYGDDFLGVNSDGRRMLCWTAHGNPPKIADLSGRAHHEPPPHSVRSLA